MKIYFAPMEGVSGYLYRNALHKVFKPEIDKYFAPFISPGPRQSLTNKELRDINPDNNKGINLIPQVLTNSAEDFLLLSERLKDFGYEEVNINLGCPSGTVVSKTRGAGLLGDKDRLRKMLDKIYSDTDMKVSLKVRIGLNSRDEFPELLDIFTTYPMEELIVHPRIRNDFYANKPDMEMFDMAVEKCSCSLCYNGDVRNKDDFDRIVNTYPDLDAIMIGRGFLRNPVLCREILTGEKCEKSDIRRFHDSILEEYINYMSGDRPVLFKMKELWSYMLDLFEASEKHGKKIKKALSVAAYKDVVNELFDKCNIK